MKKLIFTTFFFIMVMSFPVMAQNLSQEEIDQINAERIAVAEAEIARVQEAAAIKAKNELEAADATAKAFAEDVERRKDAYEDWVDSQRVLAGLEAIYDDDEEDLEPVTENVINTDIEEVLEVELPVIDEPAEEIEEVVAESEIVDSAEETIIVEEVNFDVDFAGVSLEDYDSLCRIVQTETHHGDLVGKIMVANVILNRVVNPEFPNTITGVIKAPGQFAPVRNGRFSRAVITDETRLAVNRALAGENMAGTALYFRSAKRGNTFLGKKCIVSSGGNNFYN